MSEALKDRSMLLQKEMIARHFARLEQAPERGEPVVYTFVPGNLVELIRSFGALPVRLRASVTLRFFLPLESM